MKASIPNHCLSRNIGLDLKNAAGETSLVSVSKGFMRMPRRESPTRDLDQGSTGRPKSVRGPRMFPVKVHGAAPYLTSEARRDYTGAPYRRSKFVRVTKMHISGQKRICRSTVCYTFIISCKASLQRLKIPIFLHIYVQERFRRLHHVGTPHFPWTTLRRNKNSNPVQVHSVQQVYSLVFRFHIEP
jgi:hypothetical protein